MPENKRGWGGTPTPNKTKKRQGHEYMASRGKNYFFAYLRLLFRIIEHSKKESRILVVIIPTFFNSLIC